MWFFYEHRKLGKNKVSRSYLKRKKKGNEGTSIHTQPPLTDLKPVFLISDRSTFDSQTCYGSQEVQDWSVEGYRERADAIRG